MKLCQSLGANLAILGMAVACFSCVSHSKVIPDPNDNNPPRETAVGFLAGIPFTTNSPGINMISDDVDGNGKPDIIIQQLGGGVKIIYNQCVSGNLQLDTSRPVESTESNLLDVAVGDYNDDNLLDLFLLYRSGFVDIQLQDVQGQFSQLGKYPTGGTQLCVDQVNTSDSTLDILVPHESSGDLNALYQIPGGAGVFPTFGAASLPGSNTTPLRSEYSEMALTDFEDNGLLDVVMLNSFDGSLQVYTHADDPLGPIVANPVTGEPEEPQPGVFYGHEAVWYSYSYVPIPEVGPVENPFPGEPRRVAFAYINHDALVDVAVLTNYFGPIPDQPFYSSTLAMSDPPRNLLWLFETSIEPRDPEDDWTTDNTERRTANLTPRAVLAFPNNINDVQLADVDQDGEIDVLGCGESSGAGGFSFFYFPGLGNFQFGPPIGFTVSAPPLRMLVEDFTCDGYPDVVVLLPSMNAIEVFQNDADTGLGERGTQYTF